MARVLVFVPGFAGTNLNLDFPSFGLSYRVWLWTGSFIGGGFRSLDLGGEYTPPLGAEVRAHHPIEAVYGPFVNWCQRKFAEVYTFGYDWRHRYDAAAGALAAFLTGLVRIGHRVTVVAHSAGGRLTAAASHLISDEDAAGLDRIVTVGTPWKGSYRAVEALMGQATSVRVLAALSAAVSPSWFARELAAVRRVLASMPGLYDLFPSPGLIGLMHYAGAPDPWNPAAWAAGGSPCNAGHLATSHAGADSPQLPKRGVPHLNCYADGEPTAGPLSPGDDFEGCTVLEGFGGDGVVPSESGIVADDIGRVNLVLSGTHTSLCTARGVLAALAE